jgi:hypothetical protein
MSNFPIVKFSSQDKSAKIVVKKKIINHSIIDKQFDHNSIISTSFPYKVAEI